MKLVFKLFEHFWREEDLVRVDGAARPLGQAEPSPNEFFDGLGVFNIENMPTGSTVRRRRIHHDIDSR